MGLWLFSRQKLIELADEVGSGALDMLVTKYDGALGVTLGNCLGNGGMLIPDRGPVRGNTMYRPHDPAQMYPVTMGAFANERISRCSVDRVMECQVRIDDGFQTRTLGGQTATFNENGVDVLPGLSGQPDGQSIERAPDFVEPADRSWIEPRDLDTSTGGILDKTIFLKQSQGLQHRRARHAKLFGNLFLCDAFAWRQRPIRNGVEQYLVDGLHEVRPGGRVLKA